MDVELNPDLQVKVDQWVAATGRGAGELVEDALVGYITVLAAVRGLLDDRYDDLKSGRVAAIGGEDAFVRLLAKTQTHPRASGGFVLHPEAVTDLATFHGYITADSRSRAAADRVISDIFDHIRNLAPNPRQGHQRPDLTSGPLRFERVGRRDFLIDYAPDEHPLWVIGVQNGRRDPTVLAAIVMFAMMARDEL